jgi:hypothetical protein
MIQSAGNNINGKKEKRDGTQRLFCFSEVQQFKIKITRYRRHCSTLFSALLVYKTKDFLVATKNLPLKEKKRMLANLEIL